MIMMMMMMIVNVNILLLLLLSALWVISLFGLVFQELSYLG